MAPSRVVITGVSSHCERALLAKPATFIFVETTHLVTTK